jgi:hypothetical protein
MMLIDSHHSLSLQKDLSSNHRLHQKEKDTRKYLFSFSFSFSFFFWCRLCFFFFFFFFSFLSLGHDFNLVHNSKQRQRIKKTKETKSKRIVNMILESKV